MYNREMIRRITENTTVSIGLLVFIAGGIAWLTNLNASVQEIKGKQDGVLQMKEDIAAIRVKVDSLWEASKETKK